MQQQPYPVTLCMITKNEEDRLPCSLGPVRGHVERIVVLDAESEDRTREIAQEYGAEVVVRPWTGYVDARRHVLSMVGTPWTLMIDADEVLEARFWDELVEIGFPGDDVDGFQVRRRTVYLGRRLRRASQPDWKVVLFKTDNARLEGRLVHEAVEVDGRIVRLRSEILHHSYRSAEEHVERIRRYAELAAADLQARGKRATAFDLWGRPVWRWLTAFVFKGGFVDGRGGWVMAKRSAYAVYLRYAVLRRLETSEQDPE